MNAGSNINERGCCKAMTETCSGEQWRAVESSGKIDSIASYNVM